MASDSSAGDVDVTSLAMGGRSDFKNQSNKNGGELSIL